MEKIGNKICEIWARAWAIAQGSRALKPSMGVGDWVYKRELEMGFFDFNQTPHFF